MTASIFDSLDAAEQKLGKSVAKMDEKELFKYVCAKHREVYGYIHPTDFHKDMAILTKARDRHHYHLGKMLKYIFTINNGDFKGEHFRLSWWATNCRWISDDIFVQMNEYERSFTHKTEGFASLSAIV